MSEKNGIRSNGKSARKGVRKNNHAHRFGGSGDWPARLTALAPAARVVGGLALAAAMSLGFLLTHDFLTQCDYFRADEVAVEGCRQLQKGDVLQQARVARGINILSVNLTLTRKRLLAHPWIADAQVSRELPSAIHIRVQEHTPLAVLDMGKGRRYIMNLDGEIFKAYEASDRLDAPVVRGLEFIDIPLPDRPGGDPFQAVVTALTMGRRATGVLSNESIRDIRVDREMGLTLHLSDAAPGPFRAVGIGFDDHANHRGYAVKYERLQEIIDFFRREGEGLRIEAIDLKDLDRIVINPAAGDAAEDRGRETESLSEDQKEV